MFVSAPPPSELVQAIYQEDLDSDGYVNNFTRLWCWRPEVLQAFFHTRTVLLDESDLNPGDVAVLNTAAAAARSNSYCSLAWGTKLAHEVDTDTATSVVAGSTEELNARSATLADWARRIAVQPNSTTQGDVARL